MLTKTSERELAVIGAPNIKSSKVKIVGLSPYVMNKMSSANRLAMMQKQEAGSRANKGAKREAKNFDSVYKGGMHISKGGWYGVPCSGLRTGLVDACRLTGFKMTIAKCSVFVVPDGIDADDGQPLFQIFGEPTRRDLAVKLATGTSDICSRPFFDEWYATPTLSWDADQFSSSDIVNLLARVGLQIGIGAGRHFSKNSTGMGWGCFKVATE